MLMKNAERVEVLDRSWEIVILFFGLVPALFIFWNPPLITNKWEQDFFRDLVFLNSIHTAFSFYTLWRCDEVRSAIRQSHNGDWRILPLKCLIVFTMTAFALYWLIDNHHAGLPYYLIMIIFAGYLPTQHEMSQQLGISLLYDRALHAKVTLTDKEALRLARMAKIERWAHYTVLFGMTLSWIGWMNVPQTVLPSWLNMISHGGATGYPFIFIGTVGLVFSHVLRPHWKSSNQWLYNIRRVWLLFPLDNMNFLTFQRFNHGLEYFAINGAINRNSKTKKNRWVAHTVFTLLTAVVAYLALQRITMLIDPALSSKLINILGVISGSISVTHFYYDSQIFKFSKATYRNGVLPLIMPARA